MFKTNKNSYTFSVTCFTPALPILDCIIKISPSVILTMGLLVVSTARAAVVVGIVVVVVVVGCVVVVVVVVVVIEVDFVVVVGFVVVVDFVVVVVGLSVTFTCDGVVPKVVVGSTVASFWTIPALPGFDCIEASDDFKSCEE